MSLPITDGLLVVVKDDCETCHLVVPVLGELAEGVERAGVWDWMSGFGPIAIAKTRCASSEPG